MRKLEEEYEPDEWKIELQSEIISAITGTGEVKALSTANIGMRYQFSAPGSLYKYYNDNVDRLDAVRTNKMWYSAPCNFNDVFDCEITIDEESIVKSILKLAPGGTHVRKGSHIWRKVQKEINNVSSVFNKLRVTTGVSCLSELDDSLLMWAHYANNHRGFCVEYDLMEIREQLGFTPIPIVYSDDRVCLHSINPDTVEKDSWAILIRSLSTKSPEWSYENEWRIIRDKASCGDKWNEIKKGALLEMTKPKSIILGCEAISSFEQKVKEYCSSNKVSLYKMQKDQVEYKLNKRVVLEFA